MGQIPLGNNTEYYTQINLWKKTNTELNNSCTYFIRIQEKSKNLQPRNDFDYACLVATQNVVTLQNVVITTFYNAL